jgi:hypothetical protein
MPKTRGFSEEELAALEDRNKQIFDLWLACRSTREIARVVGLNQSQVVRSVQLMRGKAQDHASEPKPPIYNVWRWSPRKGYGGPCIKCGKVNCAWWCGLTSDDDHDDSWAKTAKKLPEGIYEIQYRGATWVIP